MNGFFLPQKILLAPAQGTRLQSGDFTYLKMPEPKVKPGKGIFQPTLTLLFTALMLLGWTGTSFSQVAKNYQHWADVTVANWNGDILNANKSDYFEAEVIPHVHVISGTNKKPLITGQTYTFTIVYNFYQQNNKAGGFAFVTTYNRSRNPGLLPGASGQVPLLDNTATAGLNIGGSQGYFYTRNADITAATAPVKSGSGTFDNTVTVSFIYTGSNPQGMVEIYYGLYIAEPGQVPDQGQGATNGASAWSGGSLQTTVMSNFSGALSIQLAPSAIIRGEISGLKYRDTNNNGVRNTGEGPLSGWTIYLDLNNNGVLNTGEPSDVTDANGVFSFSVTPDADKTDGDNDPYYVRELQNQTGWTLTQPSSGFYGPIIISAADPTETGLLFGNFICINPTASETHADALCKGAADGTATISATGGTGPYTFAQGAGAYQSSGSFTGLAAGTYTFYAKDFNGCIDDVTVVIGEPDELTATATATAACNNGVLTVSLTITPSGGTGPYTITSVPTGIDGSYAYTITDANGCGCTVSSSSLKAANTVESVSGTPVNISSAKSTVNISPGEGVTAKSPLKSAALAQDKLAMSVYPNPFAGEVNFKFKSPESGYAKLEIFDIMGKKVAVVFQGNVEANSLQTAQFSAPVSNPKTILVYRLTVGAKVLSGKVLPQK